MHWLVGALRKTRPLLHARSVWISRASLGSSPGKTLRGPKPWLTYARDLIARLPRICCMPISVMRLRRFGGWPQENEDSRGVANSWLRSVRFEDRDWLAQRLVPHMGFLGLLRFARSIPCARPFLDDRTLWQHDSAAVRSKPGGRTQNNMLLIK
jgi:hypothetical protein